MNSGNKFALCWMTWRDMCAGPYSKACDWPTPSTSTTSPYVLHGFGGLPVPALIIANKMAGTYVKRSPHHRTWRHCLASC